jgi:hypothetical protein
MEASMTRSFHEADPEPDDHPPLMDAEGVVWLWDDTDEVDIPCYQRQVVTHYPGATGEGSGVVVGGPAGMEWWEIVTEYGPLREATVDEAGTFTMVMK